MESKIEFFNYLNTVQFSFFELSHNLTKRMGKKLAVMLEDDVYSHSLRSN